MASNGKANGHSHAYGEISKSELWHVHRSVLRFAEQGRHAVDYPFQWFYGLYVSYIYYLTHTVFSLHQMLTLNAEASRKDHWWVMAHHFITVFSLGASYFLNFTRVGCYIMVLMDLCDIFLPGVRMFKMMRYIGLPRIASDATFVLSSRGSSPDTSCSCSSIYQHTWISRGSFPSGGPRILLPQLQIVPCSSHPYLQILQALWFGIARRVAYRVITTAEISLTVVSSEDSNAKRDE
ncbi:hypothetical protein DFH07DRAFT_975196 [Mycena maculata]|uniref:TLC domain-containing protein n=1 Tax=Mycena maculata TaxID=230809 RepID=A0AAD7KG05_9AGAR|nr:hypothetical protein DFH07DRAFT_975196 [Mycena maculata]